MGDFIAEAGGVGGGVQEKSFEAVQRLDGQGDVIGFEGRDEGLIGFDGPIPFAFGAAAAGDVAYGAVERAGDDAGSGVGGGFDGVLKMLTGFCARGGVAGDQAQTGDQDGADGALEGVLFGVSGSALRGIRRGGIRGLLRRRSRLPL